jgi:predicted nucleic acid-binding protein
MKVRANSPERHRVYVETTIPSFYYEVRMEAEMVVRRKWTRQWWKTATCQHDLVTSAAVIAELQRGNFPTLSRCLKLIGQLTILPIHPEVDDIVEAYLRHRVMPRDPVGDALHLALASYHKCDFLVTWNCRHLANAHKFGHIRRVNTLLGLFVPTLVTPLEFLGGES